MNKVTTLHYDKLMFSGEIWSNDLQETVDFDGSVFFDFSLDEVSITSVKFDGLDVSADIHKALEDAVVEELIDRFSSEIAKDANEDQFADYEQDLEDQLMGN